MSEACFFPQSQVSTALSSSLRVTARTVYKAQIEVTGSISRHRKPTVSVCRFLPRLVRPNLVCCRRGLAGAKGKGSGEGPAGKGPRRGRPHPSLRSPAPRPSPHPHPRYLPQACLYHSICAGKTCSASWLLFVLVCYHAKSWLMH